MGYECSYLGLPISDEIADYGPPPGGLRSQPTNGVGQYYEGSSMFWNKFSGATYAYGEGGGASGFYHDPGFTQLYLTRPDQTINFDWGAGSPHPAVPADRFAVQWRTRLWVPQDGYYTFYTVSDDGVELAVCTSERGYACGNTFIISNWTEHPITEDTSAPIFLKRGTHFLGLFYFEAFGGATIKLLWSGPGIPKQVIPRANLDPTFIGPPNFGSALSVATGDSSTPEGLASDAGSAARAGAPRTPPHATPTTPTTTTPTTTTSTTTTSTTTTSTTTTTSFKTAATTTTTMAPATTSSVPAEAVPGVTTTVRPSSTTTGAPVTTSTVVTPSTTTARPPSTTTTVRPTTTPSAPPPER
jgi:hypothetical protein